MNNTWGLVLHLTIVLAIGCYSDPEDQTTFGPNAPLIENFEPAVQDARLHGKWIPADYSENYTVVITRAMLIICNEDKFDHFEFNVTHNQPSSTEIQEIVGKKVCGRFNKQATKDRGTEVRFTYETDDNYLRLVRILPVEAEESVCPSHLELVRSDERIPNDQSGVSTGHDLGQVSISSGKGHSMRETP